MQLSLSSVLTIDDQEKILKEQLIKTVFTLYKEEKLF